jgi:excisionase family DNA binding protein
MSEKLAYTIAEVVSLTPLSRSAVYREIAAGKLAAKRIGSRTAILAADLHNYLAGLPAAQEAKAS